MAIGSNAPQEELDASCVGNLVLVRLAFSLQITSIAVENVDVLGPNVYVREEMLVHETMITFRMIAGDPNVLILSVVSYLLKHGMRLCGCARDCITPEQQGRWSCQ